MSSLDLPPPSNRRRNKRRGGRTILFLAILGLALIPFLPWAKKGVSAFLGTAEKGPPTPPPEPEIQEKIVYRDRVVEKEVRVVEKAPLPSKHVPYTEVDVAKLYNGVNIKTNLTTVDGGIASVERKSDPAFEVTYNLKVTVPKAGQTVEELASVNKHLPKILPSLPTLLDTGKVSGFFNRMYKLKTANVKQSFTRLNKVLSRHNFFDLETVLELEHPETKQKVLLLQGDMDVVSDGSDGDRSPEYDEYIAKSQHYQPFTSYGWRKQTDQPNPLLSRWEEKLAARKASLKESGISSSRKRSLQGSIKTLNTQITDLKRRSFLIARKDPFVVVSLSMLGYTKKSSFAPRIGDYVVVIHEDKVYPAILGDAGPRTKVGEASLRIARTIDPKASPYRRPVNDLTVTYLMFPNTAEKPNEPPRLDHWHAKCQELLDGLGGLGDGYELHQWEDLFEKERLEREAKEKAEAEAKAAATPAQ